MRITLEPGTLFEAVRERSAQAERVGALRSIPTSFELVEDGETGVEFVVRMVDHLGQKREAASEQQRTGANPFLPYNRELFVADLSETHLCLLNKYNVLDHHLLIVTRSFEEQESLLTLEDFEALWLCMAEREGLGFYNAGAEAGASQPHKHLQLVSVPDRRRTRANAHRTPARRRALRRSAGRRRSAALPPQRGAAR